MISIKHIVGFVRFGAVYGSYAFQDRYAPTCFLCVSGSRFISICDWLTQILLLTNMVSDELIPSRSNELLSGLFVYKSHRVTAVFNLQLDTALQESNDFFRQDGLETTDIYSCYSRFYGSTIVRLC